MEQVFNSDRRLVVVNKKNECDARVVSEELMGGMNRLTIEHANEEYVLRVTRAGKLILTK